MKIPRTLAGETTISREPDDLRKRVEALTFYVLNLSEHEIDTVRRIIGSCRIVPGSTSTNPASDVDLVILGLDTYIDLQNQTPSIDGKDLFWCLQLLTLGIPWIAVTEYPNLFPIDRCLQAGAMDCWVRPFGVSSQLEASIRRIRENPPPRIVLQPEQAFLRVLLLVRLLRGNIQFQLIFQNQSNGTVILRNGLPCYAEIDGSVFGGDALRRMLSEPCNRFKSKLILGEFNENLSQEETERILDIRLSKNADNRAFAESNPIQEANVFSADPQAGENRSVRSDFSDNPNPNQAAFGIFHPAQEERPVMAVDLNKVCQTVFEDTTDALACGIIDLSTGMLLGVYHNVPYFTQAYLDAVAAASVDMFRGKNVRRIEELLTKQRGRPAKDSFEEIFVSSSHVFHFMKVIREKQVVVVLITKKTTNQGMGWSALRNAIPDFTASLK